MTPLLNVSYKGLRAVVEVHTSVDVVAVMLTQEVLLPMIIEMRISVMVFSAPAVRMIG